MSLRMFLAWILSAVAFGGASQVCDLAIHDCPRRFASDTVSVSKDVIWLDPKIPYCNEPVQLNGGNNPPPSIVFIIDNSGSMDENDPVNARFSVVTSLLEDINALSPDAQVGLVVFTRRLAFDHRENSLFKTAFPGDTTQHDSFVPLTALNKIFPGGMSGLDTLKAMLKHDDRGNLTYNTRLPASRNNSGMGRINTRDGTDISLGFMTAKMTMKDSKADKANQYFIFLSDGAPSTPDNGRESLINDFMAGANTPTTYTVFFDTQNSIPVAPSTIVEMTSNIKVNGYSLSNPKSMYWAINLPGSQLRTILQGQVVGNILSVTAKPKQATLTLGEKTYQSTGIDSGNFVFPKRLALTENTTVFQLYYTYTYTDTTGGKQVAKEKLVPYTLTVLRSDDNALPFGVGKSCRDQAGLSLFHDGSPISVVTDDDESLDVHLVLPPGEVCVGCKIEVLPSSPKSIDRELLSLTPTGNYASASFHRETSTTPIPGDGTFQHLASDSIVLLYINPTNPLDVVRRSFPFKDVQSTLEIHGFNTVSRVRPGTTPAKGAEWVLMAPPALRVSPEGTDNHWRLRSEPLTVVDSLQYVGVLIEASRGFKVDIRVFSNLGQFLNKLTFSVPQTEFQNLSPGAKRNTQTLRILWDGRSLSGSLAGTGAYVLKTKVTLPRIPGIAEDEVFLSDIRRVGVLRSF